MYTDWPLFFQIQLYIAEMLNGFCVHFCLLVHMMVIYGSYTETIVHLFTCTTSCNSFSYVLICYNLCPSVVSPNLVTFGERVHALASDSCF